jgi:hypothetical protein
MYCLVHLSLLHGEIGLVIPNQKSTKVCSENKLFDSHL